MIDTTQILIAVIGGVFAVIQGVSKYYINQRLKDTKDAATLSNAIDNSLGAMQQAADGVIQTLKPGVPVPSVVPPMMQVGLQYVLDHAGDEMSRFGLSSDAIVDKINAKIGLEKIADPVVPTALPTVNSK